MAASSPARFPEDRRKTPPLSLVDAVRRVVHSGNVQRLAETTGLPARLLYRAATDAENPSGDHRKLPLDAVLPLTEATGDPEIIRYLAQQTGHLLVPAPSGETSPASFLGVLASYTVEHGDVQRVSGQALPGGIDPGEAQAIVQECDEAMTKLATLRAVAMAAARRPLARIAR